MDRQETSLHYINTIKTIGIFCVVFAHLSLPNELLKFINIFHMPLFFFISGYLFSMEKYDFQNLIKRKAKTLLIPYLFFAICSYIFWYFIGSKYGNNTLTDPDMPIQYAKGILFAFPMKEYLGFNIPIWFLPCLFVSELLFFLINKQTGKYALPISMIIYIIGIAIKEYLPFRLPWGIDVALFALLFIQLGYLFRTKNGFNKYINRLKPDIKLISCGCFFILTYLLAQLNIGESTYVTMYSREFNSHLLFLPASLSGICFMFLGGAILPQNRIFNFYGRNTILILGFHLICFSFIKAIQVFLFHIPIEKANETILPNLLYTCLAFLFLSPVILGINKYFPYLLGRKKGILY